MTIDPRNSNASPSSIEPSASLPPVHIEEFLPAIYPWNLFGWLLLLITLGTGAILITLLPVSVTRGPTIAPPHSTQQ